FMKSEMPGTKEEIGAEAFFEAFADFVMPLVERSGNIGFCFSYAAEVTPECDARLIRWSKQIKAPEVEGRLIGTGLKRKLAMRGHERNVVILNDTVATLLAGKSAGVARAYSAYVGFILGTGTNTAYVEQNARITKRSDLDPAGSMVINVESGAFRRIEQSVFDRVMDAATNDPGHYTFEKMISGAYLGTLGFVVLKEAIKAGFFSAAAQQAIVSWSTLSNKHLDDFCGGKPTADNPFLAGAFTAEDHALVRALCTPVYARSAILTAINLASAILKTGAGLDPARPVCVNVDGSTYYRTLSADFQALVQRELAALLKPYGVAYELVKIDDSPVIGAAVAGLM
ncbi:MAG: hexokinase, partial [Clostridia bacterium]|nr:hexokinase [Clostridia bacterium]